MSKFKNAKELEKAYKELEKEFTKKSQSVAILESKLAGDCDKCLLKHEELIEMSLEKAKQISDLEAKLAESEKEIKLANKLLNELLFSYEKLKDNNDQLKQQLAEKQKELEYKTAECEKWKTDYKNCSELEKIMSKEHQYCLDNWRASEQDKISFAVEQLEKVKENLIEDLHPFYSRPCTIYKVYGDMYEDFLIENINTIIDNQIKAIKGDEVV